MQQLSKEETLDINLMIAHVRVLSEILHIIPAHKQRLKQYFKLLFNTIKRYETELLVSTTFTPGAYEQTELVYDELMKLTLQVREICLAQPDAPKVELAVEAEKTENVEVK